MNRIRTIAPLVILFVLAVAAAGYAQQASKIAVINSEQAFQTSAEGKKAIAQLAERENKVKAELQKQDDAIRLLENKLTTGRLTMTNEALAGIQADIEQKTTQRKRYEEDQAREINQFGSNLMQRIRTEMVAIIEALAKERGYDLVLDMITGGVVTSSPTVDITKDVIARYDQSKAAAPPVKK